MITIIPITIVIMIMIIYITKIRYKSNYILKMFMTQFSFPPGIFEVTQSKVEAHAVVNILYSYQLWWAEPLTNRNTLMGSKVK